MIRVFGIIKVLIVLLVDFIAIGYLFGDAMIASIVTGVIALYVWLGGYLALLKEGAISSKKLSSYEAIRLETAKEQLVESVRKTSSVNISRLKVYLVPGDDDLNATAYGSNCVSVTRGTFNTADPVTLAAVLGHEVSHILNCDAEFNRAIFASVTLVLAAFSVMSAITVIVIFLLFLLLNCFRSWLGVLVYQGATRVTNGLFGLLQHGIVAFYRCILGLISRHAEYRCDSYSCMLGYGIQLAHFLSLLAPQEQRTLTLTDALYRSHPPTEKRIARLERQMNNGAVMGRERV